MFCMEKKHADNVNIVISGVTIEYREGEEARVCSVWRCEDSLLEFPSLSSSNVLHVASLGVLVELLFFLMFGDIISY